MPARDRLLKLLWKAHSRGWDTMRSAPASLQHIDDVVDAFAAHLPPSARVVDLGRGAGHHTIALARHGVRVTGTDYADAMLGRARDAAAHANLDVELRTADLNAPLPYAPATFDAAICISVLQVINDPAGFLRNVHTVLKDNGMFAVEQVNYWGARSESTPSRGFDKLVNAAKIAIARRSKTLRRLDEKDVGTLCRDTGFDVVDTKTYDQTFVVTARTRAT